MARFLNQALHTLVACVFGLSVGMNFTWPSSTFRNFASANSSLHRTMTETELSLFGSLSSGGALITIPMAGFFLDVIGRKSVMISVALTQVVAWTMIATWNTVEVVLAATFITGAGGCITLVVGIYVSEICQTSIRGAMIAVLFLFNTIGMLVSYTLGGCLSYQSMVYVCLAMSFVVVCLLAFVRETPLFYLKKGMDQEAVNSLAFYRNSKPNSKSVLEELNAIRKTLNPDIEYDDVPEMPDQELLRNVDKVENVPREKLSFWQFIKKSPSTRQAALVTIVLVTASLFQGLLVIQVYAEPLFEKAVPNMSPNTCSIIFAAVSVIVGVPAAYLTESAGRRPLLIYGSIASGICCVVLGTQLQYHWAPHWVTALLIYIFTVPYTIGGGTVPFVLAPEVFLPEVKSIMAMIVVEWVWICNFIILFIFNPLVAAIGLGPLFFIFAVVCFFTSIYAFFYLPETKGLTVDVIQIKFTEGRSRKH